MLSAFGKFSCILVIISLVDGYSLLFQTYAWATMLYDRIPEQGIEQAIDSTFSGKAPCPLCISLKEAEKEKHGTPFHVVPESSTFAKYIPNSIEKIDLSSPSPTRLALNRVALVPTIDVYLAADVPPPDFC